MTDGPLDVSVVIPVYRGEATLPGVVAELADLREPRCSPKGLTYRIAEVVLVWDRGPDRSDEVIRTLAAEHDWVRPVWLSRNFGQHPAIVAGMAAAGGDWIVTMDEDGQHDPGAIGAMLDLAFAERTALVYAAPTAPPPHSRLRNAASSFVKGPVLSVLTGGKMVSFHSYRLVAGEIGRSIAAFVGPGVYLDVALSWVVERPASCPVPMRAEGRDDSGYGLRSLLGHLSRLVISSGTRPLRLVSVLGAMSILLGGVGAAVALVLRLSGAIDVQGWTSLVVVILLGGGLIMLSLGTIAEYVGFGASMSMGRPTYLSVSDPQRVFGPARPDSDTSDDRSPG